MPKLKQVAPVVAAEYVPVTADGIQARMGDRIKSGLVTYEIVMARKDHVIAKVTGPHKAGVLTKVQLPLVFGPAGVVVNDLTYELLLKKGTEPKKASSTKRPGPKARGDGPTKMDLCRAIWKANPNLSKLDMCTKFIDEAKCTKMGANTYYLTLKKENT